MLKRSLRTLMNDFAPLVSDVTQLVISMYDAVPNPAILDIAKQVIYTSHMILSRRCWYYM